MSGALEGRVALVSGASRGIGRAIAEAYADAGADVAVMARDVSLLDEVAAAVRSRGRRAAVVPADVLDADAVATALATAESELGPIDILVNNAGGNSFSIPFAQMRFSGWEKTLRLNLDSVVRLTQAVVPGMVERRRGSIINISSVAGLQGAPLMSHYAAAKAALISLTQSLAIEVAYAGVRVNALAPGWIDTDLTAFLRVEEGADAGLISRVPMGRWGRPEEIAAPAVFLASDAASFVTGHCLVADGGLTAMP